MGALWNSFKIAFSMYSKIPMPQSAWSKENMRYVMCFFPLVGMVSGALTIGWMALLPFLHLDGGGFGLGAAVFTLIPVAVTGGIHLDGFLDTSDALGSWQEPERRLEILKDSCAGAFAVIMGCVYFALSLGVYTTFQDVALAIWREGSFGDMRILFQAACVYMISRSLSGLAIVTRPMAKNTGLAAAFSDGAQKRTVAVTMAFYLVVCCAAVLFFNPLPGAVSLLVGLAIYIYYGFMAKSKFGGVTGDLAGWFVQVIELGMLLALTVATLLIGGTGWN
ncbi:MAG: adenosylcobinamide-GDP ribazoletransferase [Lachnospiraceae bacterium]|nr:adenosylcobinamide-GDP ribazoletransferase [Lachnospiraceae bacterium]